jgi:signal recognition particle subunit SRP54
MMKKMAAGGGMPGMPGMPGMGGGGGARKGAKSAPKKKARSGNPAKAAQELRDAEARRAAGPKALPTGASFGQQGADFDPSQLNLPKGFDKFLGGSK